jgi:putative membrane protein
VKIVARLGLVLGVCVTVALVANTGWATIVRLLLRASWWLPWLIPLHAVPLLLDAAGWRALLPARFSLRKLFWIAAIREGINRLLPVANVGGEVVGIHLLMRQGIGAPMASASVVVETLMTLISQCIFAAIGVECIIRVAGWDSPALGLLASIAMSALVAFALGTLLLRGSAFHRLEQAWTRLLGNFSRESLHFSGKSLDRCVQELFASQRRLFAAMFWQVSGLLVGCTETWLVLRWLGHPISGGAAIALESLTQMARSIFFVVPAGLGIQEAGLIGLGRIIGIDADVAMSLSLAKRLREISFSLPALAAWQIWEGRPSPARLHKRSDP